MNHFEFLKKKQLIRININLKKFSIFTMNFQHYNSIKYFLNLLISSKKYIIIYKSNINKVKSAMITIVK